MWQLEHGLRSTRFRRNRLARIHQLGTQQRQAFMLFPLEAIELLLLGGCLLECVDGGASFLRLVGRHLG